MDAFWTQAGFFVQLAVLVLALGGATAGFYRCWANKQAEIANWRHDIEKMVDDNSHRNEVEGREINRLQARMRDHDDARLREEDRVNTLSEKVADLGGEVRVISRRMNGGPKHH